MSTVTVAVIQRPPCLLDRATTLERAVAGVHEAAARGAALAVFPEAFVPGYPVWIWSLRPGPDYGLTDEIHARLLANSVDLAAGELAPLQEAAATTGTVVVCGLHERDDRTGGATLFNTMVTIGADGAIANRHRKLMPTNPERMVWGQGDASGLRVAATAAGRIGTLVCWESLMPLARYALYAEGIEVYVTSTWDSGPSWLASMQHIAAEGRCWVVGAGSSLRTDDVPADFPGYDRIFGGEPRWLNPGDSVVVAPGGQVVAGPLHEQHDILYAEVDLAAVPVARRTFDVAGHYSRSDVFRLTVDRSPHPAVTDMVAGDDAPAT